MSRHVYHDASVLRGIPRTDEIISVRIPRTIAIITVLWNCQYLSIQVGTILEWLSDSFMFQTSRVCLPRFSFRARKIATNLDPMRIKPITCMRLVVYNPIEVVLLPPVPLRGGPFLRAPQRA